MPRKTAILSSLAYEQLKERIAEMPSGQYLSARQYALDLGMSYTPVREAFLRLQNEGVLRQVPNVGFFVAAPDIADMIEFFQARECIEVFALRKVFYKLDADWLSRMRECCDEMHEAMRVGEFSQAMQADESFHRSLLNLLGNSTLLATYDAIRAKYQRCAPMLADGAYDLGERSHRRFLCLVEEGDVEGAAEELTRHIADAKNRLIESFITHK